MAPGAGIGIGIGRLAFKKAWDQPSSVEMGVDFTWWPPWREARHEPIHHIAVTAHQRRVELARQLSETARGLRR